MCIRDRALNTIATNPEIDDLRITQHNPNTAPVMLIAVKHNEITDMNEIRKVAESYIRNELIRLEGVAEVELSGQEAVSYTHLDVYKRQVQGSAAHFDYRRNNFVNQRIWLAKQLF